MSRNKNGEVIGATVSSRKTTIIACSFLCLGYHCYYMFSLLYDQLNKYYHSYLFIFDILM